MTYPTVRKVHDVAVVGEDITWKYDATTQSIGASELLFALKSQSNSGYVLCALQEKPDDASAPFELILVQAAAVPPELTETNTTISTLPQHLQHNFNNYIVDVIVSVKSGTGRSLLFWETVLQPLLALVSTELGVVNVQQLQGYNTILTESESTVSDYAKQISQNHGPKPRTIILLSGDGGVVDLLNNYTSDAADYTQPVIALLPLGTGNALFHSLHKQLYENKDSSQYVYALRTLFHGEAADLPTFRASFSEGSRKPTFNKLPDPDPDHIASDPAAKIQEGGGEDISHLLGAIVASYGFHASIIYESDTPEYRIHGDKRFGMVAQNLLQESHPYAAKLEVKKTGGDFEEISRDVHAYVLTTLVSNLERTFTISPGNKPLDGKLHLIHFGAIGGERTMDVMMKAYDNGKHVDMKWDDGEAVGYEEVDEIRITALDQDPRWRKVCIDGTIIELPERGQMTVQRETKSQFRVLADAKLVSTGYLRLN